MDFELKDIEMLEDPNKTIEPRHELLKSSSLVLNELQKENEILQNKLKLNYRRLLLFETENNKLIEEKNKFFFESKNHIEKSTLLEDKNNELESENEEISEKLQLLNEKVYTLEKISKSQLSEIKRFAKFHLKIQNVVKPFILQLKASVENLKKEVTSTKSQLDLFKSLNEQLEKQNNDLTEQKDNETKIYQIDRTELTRSYEEQIHSFSKEILSLQNQNETLAKEVSRLKKSVEYKNYFENEVIKFKRIHEEDQIKLQNLTDLKNRLDTEILSVSEDASQAKIYFNQIQTRLAEKENLLEVTRKQLAKQLDEVMIANDRINRLEKLNNQLSLEMSQSN